MNTTKFEMKKEALKRMKLLGLKSEALNEFRNNNVVKYSKTEMVSGKKVTVLENVDPKMKAYINMCEQMNGILVYHAIYTADEKSEYLTILFVLPDKTLWRTEREMIADKDIFTFVIDLTYLNKNALRNVRIKKSNGGLIRVR